MATQAQTAWPIDWDEAFDNAGHVPGAADLAARWTGAAAAFRDAARADLDLGYGPGARNRFDLFRPEGAVAGLIVFVHGGYWHKFDKSHWSHLAAGPLAAGWAVAMPSYTLAPEGRVSQMTGEVGQAIAAAAARVAGPIRLIGHSAGGHLVSRMACANAPLTQEMTARLDRVISLSGLHDLRPLLGTRMNDILGLTPEEAAAESAALLTPRMDLDTLFWVGAAERPEFLRQTRLIAEVWGEGGARVRDHYDPGHNHFTVAGELARPDSDLVQALVG
ncbi:alpha/beta hydrolase [Antarcticimicrobium luteum]|uniref:Alpha/beta fold hydrolase n=1 Tax=Antarcticimicrobium luteum TaxID=2547397 RepID=A0A4R5VHN1_9RHOB|nr:alpha/beta hydrolase [Antarcticimicrobium luteum]TDK51808.1 alpha/beta fold hydrolase [Antarcticimicrobium luteum]